MSARKFFQVWPAVGHGHRKKCLQLLVARRERIGGSEGQAAGVALAGAAGESEPCEESFDMEQDASRVHLLCLRMSFLN